MVWFPLTAYGETVAECYLLYMSESFLSDDPGLVSGESQSLIQAEIDLCRGGALSPPQKNQVPSLRKYYQGGEAMSGLKIIKRWESC